MREVPARWIAALRACTGNERDTIRFNTVLHRWEFQLTEADGQQRSQFWGVYHDPQTGAKLAPDPETGLWPFRELDDAGMREALANLTSTFLGNPHDGAGTARRQAVRRMRANRLKRQREFRRAAEAFTDMVAERGTRLRGATQLAVPAGIAARPT